MAIRVIYGPPGAGKTTYISEHRKVGDIVIDMDALAVALGSPDDHDHPSSIKQVAGYVRVVAIRKALEVDADTWVVDTWLRTGILHETPGCEYVVVDPGQTVTLRRAEASGRPERSMDAIRRWYLNPPTPPCSAISKPADDDHPADLGGVITDWW